METNKTSAFRQKLPPYINEKYINIINFDRKVTACRRNFKFWTEKNYIRFVTKQMSISKGHKEHSNKKVSF